MTEQPNEPADGTAQARIDAALRLCDLLADSQGRVAEHIVAAQFRAVLTGNESR